jgi:uncharacterized protein
MKSSVAPVKILNRNRCHLFGMLHEPEVRRHEQAILLLSPGIKSHVAPHRLYLKMANRFCALGFVVLRVDPEGLGDSEGEIDEYLVADVYGSVELGRLVSDTIDVMDWMQSKHGIDSFILGGLCGGAITGLLTGAIDKRVVSLLGLGLTCIVSGSKQDPIKYLTQGQLDSLRGKYLRKMADPSSIVRFLTFRTDYRLLFKSLVQPLHQKLKYYRINKKKGSLQGRENDSASSNLNPHFPKAFVSFVREKKMLLIFSGADRLYWEFEEKYMSRYHDDIAPFNSKLTIHIVKNANHIFSFSEWQDEMLSTSCAWLSKQYPAQD